MILYGVYALFAPRLPHVSWGGRIADAAAGFFGGLVGGVAGLSGIAPAIWTQLRGWSKRPRAASISRSSCSRMC